jgi:apolipoprotein N-acyltransferase
MRLRSFNWRALALACASGVLLALAFSGLEIGWLAWVALVPLVVALRDARPLAAFALSWVTGGVFIVGSFYWILNVPGYNILDELLLAGYLGSYVAVWGLGLAAFRSVTGGYGVLLAPALWVSLEYLRGHIGFLSLPWMFLGHSQYSNIPVIQVAAFTGVYGVSWLIVLVNVAIGRAIDPLGEWRSVTNPGSTIRGAMRPILAAGLLLVVVLTYGLAILSMSVDRDHLRVAVVQGNIALARKWDPASRASIMERHTRLARAAVQDAPQLIVWPETAVPGDVLHQKPLRDALARLAIETQTHLLVGSAEFAKFTDRRLVNRFYNSMFLISPSGAIEGQYKKIQLVPFGEYEPLSGIVPWPQALVSAMGGILPGNDFTTFSVGKTRLATVICWEILFSDLVRGFVKAGARLIVNATNEAWFGDSAAPRQMLGIAAFRAVENRVGIVRAANTGISAFIDPFGRITHRLRGPDGREAFVEGVLTADTIVSSGTTFYTHYGDVFVFTQIAVCLLLPLAVRLRRREVVAEAAA